MQVGRLFVLCGLAFGAQTGSAYDYERQFDANNESTWPVIAIIIDDIGDRARDGARAVNLPGPIACAILPHTPHGQRLARRAHTAGKEVMLHLPLEATSHNELLGNGAITLDDSQLSFAKTLKDNLNTVPFAVGINNHMGSLLTRHPGHMRWLMQAMAENGELFFVDSMTTRRSVAMRIAREYSIPAIKRDVFLDSVQTREAIAVQFDRLKDRARRKGYAVAIGHPFPETLDVLEAQLPLLHRLGYRLVSVKSIISHQARINNGTDTPTRLSSTQGSQPGLAPVHDITMNQE